MGHFFFNVCGLNRNRKSKRSWKPEIQHLAAIQAGIQQGEVTRAHRSVQSQQSQAKIEALSGSQVNILNKIEMSKV